MTAEPAGLRHQALVYADEDDFVSCVGTWLREGLSAGEETLLVAPRPKLSWLRDELGPEAVAVTLVDATDFSGPLGPVFAGLERMHERHAAAGGGPVRLAAELDLHVRAASSADAFLRWEAAVNVLYADYPASILCPYDATRLSDETLTQARATHPDLLEGGRLAPSAGFTDPATFLEGRARSHPARAAAGESWRLRGPEDLGEVRRHVRDAARREGLGEAAGADLALAADEIAANAILHGEPPRSFQVVRDGADLLCAVRDAGPGPADPLAGFRTPDRRRGDGRGLWLANQLCDVVEIRALPTGAEVVVRMAVPGT